MAEALHYCDVCGKRISRDQISSGRATVSDAYAVCADCVAQMTPEQRRKLEGLAPRGAEGHPEKRPHARAHTGHHRHPSPKMNTKTAATIAVVAAGMMLGVVVALLVAGPSGGDGARPDPSMSSPLATPPVAPSPPAAPPRPENTPVTPTVTTPVAIAPVPAAAATGGGGPAALLAALRRRIEPQLLEYADIVEGLKAIVAEHPGTPEAAEATRLLDEVERKFVPIAAGRFASALRTARETAAKGDHERAKGMLDYTVSWLKGSRWYETEGAAAVEAAKAEFDRAAAEARRAEEELKRKLEAAGGGSPAELLGSFPWAKNVIPGDTDALTPGYRTKVRHWERFETEGTAPDGWGACAWAEGAIGEFAVVKDPVDGRPAFRLTTLEGRISTMLQHKTRKPLEPGLYVVVAEFTGTTKVHFKLEFKFGGQTNTTVRLLRDTVPGRWEAFAKPVTVRGSGTGLFVDFKAYGRGLDGALYLRKIGVARVSE